MRTKQHRIGRFGEGTVAFVMALVCVTAGGPATAAPLQLEGGFQNYGGSPPHGAYASATAVRHGNLCFVEGLIRKFGLRSLPKSGLRVATLPVSCRPKSRLMFLTNHHETTSRIDVYPDGRIVWQSGFRRDWLSLGGIVFKAGKSGGTGGAFAKDGSRFKAQLATGWMNYGGPWDGPRWTRDKGLCVVTGLIKREPGKGWGEDRVHVGTLPQFCRPTGDLIFKLHDNDHGRPARVDVSRDGRIDWRQGGKRSWLNLSGIVFPVGQSGVTPAYLRSKDYQGGAWADLGAVRLGDVCVLQGLISAGEVKDLVRLPAECQPLGRLLFNVRTKDAHFNAGTTRVNIEPDGRVWVVKGKVGGWVSLSGINFQAPPKATTPAVSNIADNLLVDPPADGASFQVIDPNVKNLQIEADFEEITEIAPSVGETTITKLLGGRGGTTGYDLVCPDKDVVTGIAVTQDGERITGLSIRCQDFDQNGMVETRFGDGSLIRGRTTSANNGEPQQGERVFQECIDFEPDPRRPRQPRILALGAVAKVEARVERLAGGLGPAVVTKLAFNCRTVTPNGPQDPTYSAIDAPSSDTTNETRTCGRGEVAYGIRGKFGTHLDGMVLLCRRPGLTPADPAEANWGKVRFTGPAEEAELAIGSQIQWSPVPGAQSYAVTFKSIGEFFPCSLSRLVTDNRFIIDRDAALSVGRRLCRVEVQACAASGRRCGESGRREYRLPPLPFPELETPAGTTLQAGSFLRWLPIDDSDRHYVVCLFSGEFSSQCRGEAKRKIVLRGSSYQITKDDFKEFAGGEVRAQVTACTSNPRIGGNTCRPLEPNQETVLAMDRMPPVQGLLGPPQKATIDAVEARFSWTPPELDVGGTYVWCLQPFDGECEVLFETERSSFEVPTARVNLLPFVDQTMFWSVSHCPRRSLAHADPRCSKSSEARAVQFTNPKLRLLIHKLAFDNLAVFEDVELALVPEARSKGLTGRDEVPPGSGMLFVFPDAVQREIRPNPVTPSLQVAFVDADLRIVAIDDFEPGPRALDEDDADYEARVTISSNGEAARYMLQVGSDAITNSGIQIGDVLAVNTFFFDHLVF